ncbi:MAG: glycosyltransferase family 9 protein [Elusimicrobia bacterium]|nr:glycosyltransferase family 9 protein [Elusimicrobiota bacterium]
MKILIVRLSSIGDIILSTPLIRCLRNKFPDAQIDFILKKEYSELLSRNPYISNLILYDGRVFEFSKRLKSEKYDVIIDIHRNFRSFLLLLFAGTKVLKYKNFALKRFFLVEFGINLYKENIPVSRRYLDTVRPLGVLDDNKGLDFFIDEKVNNKTNISGNCIGFCPVSVWKTKRWSEEYFVKLAGKILETYNHEIMLFGGKNDFQYCENIKNKIGNKAKNLCGLSFQESALLLRKCKYLFTNDTGLMHVAEALKVPVAAFFGPTVKEFGFYPDIKTSYVFSKNLSCKPCSTKGSNICSVADFKCMKNISVEEVFLHCAASL